MNASMPALLIELNVHALARIATVVVLREKILTV